VRIKAALRTVAKARRPDPVLLYMNGQTVVADDPDAPGDGLRKYFLPHDADLVELERLRALPASAERTTAILAHLDRTAISFSWIAETLNQASIEDHRYIMSREVVLVFDCAFPGPLGLRYAPAHEALVAGGGVPSGGGAPLRREDTRSPPIEGDGSNPEQTPPEQTPPEQTPPEQTPPEEPKQLEPEQPKQAEPEEPKQAEPEEPKQAEPEEPKQAEPEEPKPTRVPDPTPVEEPAPAPATEPAPAPRKPRRMSQRGVQGTTLPAEAESEEEGAPVAQLSMHFLDDLGRRPGRKVVVTVRWNEGPLDVTPQKAGGFVYHFLRGARDRGRVPGRAVSQGAYRHVVESGPLLDYVRARVEDESRTLNRPQSILSLGDNDDFPVIVIKRDE
jgi:hypothetical protein